MMTQRKTQRNTKTYAPKFCSGCRTEGHSWSIRNNELSSTIANTSQKERIDNHPSNENYNIYLRETLVEYREYLSENSQSISYKSLKDFCGTKNWRFIPYTLERVLTTCPQRIAFLEPKITQNKEAGDRQRMRLAQAVIRGAMIRFWIRKNMKLIIASKKADMERAARIREYKNTVSLDIYARKRAGDFQRRSSGLNSTKLQQMRRKEKGIREEPKPQPKPEQPKKRQNNTFRKELGEKWTPETYYEFLMDIHSKTNKSDDDAPRIENIYYAVVEKTFGGSWISVLKFQSGILLGCKVNLNPRMFRDWARGKKSAKGQKVQLEGGLLCLVHIDEVIQLYSNREKNLLIEQGIVTDKFEGNIENIKEESSKDTSKNVSQEETYFVFANDSEDSVSEADSEDSVSEADSEDSDEETQPGNLAKFIKAKAGTSKWLYYGDDSDSEDEEPEKSEEPKATAKWSYDDSEDEEESGPVREKRISRAERMSKKQEERKAKLAREREARKAAARAKEEEIDREISQNFDSFLESI